MYTIQREREIKRGRESQVETDGTCAQCQIIIWAIEAPKHAQPAMCCEPIECKLSLSAIDPVKLSSYSLAQTFVIVG